MTRNALIASAFGAAMAVGLAAGGCSSTSNGSGTGGAIGTGGGTADSGATGTGGRIGTGGTTAGTGGRADAGSDAPAALPMCPAPAPGDGTSCNSNPSCTKNCGVDISMLSLTRPQKACTCSGANGTWSCPSTNGACKYPTDVDLTCLTLPATLPACPRDLPDGGGVDAGSGLIRPGVSNCEVPGSEVCGNPCGSANANAPSYQDGNGMGKVGYCVCIGGKYQCASVNEWYYP
jgi:hypothetical protein